MTNDETDKRILALVETLSRQAIERNVKFDQLAARLEAFGAQLVRQDERGDRLQLQLDKLIDIVAGSDERSLVLRLSRLEQIAEVLRKDMANNAKEVEDLTRWKSRAAGVVVAVLILWTVITTMLAFLLR
jgi:hypothetical protein